MRTRRKPKTIPVSSPMLTLIVILSALLFATLSLVSCKNDVNGPPPPKVVGRDDRSSPPPPPPLPAPRTGQPMAVPVPEVEAKNEVGVVGGSAGYVVGGVAGGVVGGVIGGVPSPAMKRVTSAADVAEFNTEEYGRFQENPFLKAVDNPLSTFSIDVDRASYSNVRRYLTAGQRPPRDAVRIEELINYFSYDYPDPRGADPFSVTTEVAACPWNAKNRLLLVGLQARRMKTADLPPSNLVFLIDVSGSMEMPNKLPLVKDSLGLLVNQLRAQDRVAIVVYAGNAGLVLPSTPGSNKGAILSAIQALEAGGSTAGGSGIKLAYGIAKENFIDGGNNRVILATDGDFNVGASSDGELEQLIEQKRKDRIFLTVLGFGMGNLKDSKMELLADKGNGNYAYIDDLSEARKTLVHEMGGTLFTVAKDVKLQIEFNPAKVLAYRLIGYENRLLRKEDFHDDTKDAGELGAGHSVTALYELVPPDGDQALAQVDPLKYQTTAVAPAAKSSPELLTLKLRYKAPDSDTSKLMTETVADQTGPFATATDNLRFAASVAELGMLLRNSPHKGTASFGQVREIAQKALGRDFEGYRHDFLSMISMAERVPNTEEVASR
jgi:Ca-activated chloride channel family protein